MQRAEGADKLLDRQREKAEWARREGSRVDVRLDTITEEEAQLVKSVKAMEAPLPTIKDRWGNEIPVVGYGEGEYYRLSRQPIWVIRQLATGPARVGQTQQGNSLQIEGEQDSGVG